MYNDILRYLRDAFRRKRHEKRRNISRFLLHDNASAYRSVLVKHFLANKNVAKLGHPPTFAPADFYVFHRIKSALK